MSFLCIQSLCDRNIVPRAQNLFDNTAEYFKLVNFFSQVDIAGIEIGLS